VHSPLVGPATWQPVAAELRRRGVEVAVPCLVEPASRGDWHGCVDAAAGGALPGSTLVAHSGAGPLLPVIASRLASPAVRLVFVDAGVPPALGHASLASSEFLAHLRTLAIDGRLPKWSEWFGDGAMDGLVPDPASRAAILMSARVIESEPSLLGLSAHLLCVARARTGAP